LQDPDRSRPGGTGKHLNTSVIFALSLVHFTGDFYAAFLTLLLPLFVDKLGLTLTLVGFLAGIRRFLTFSVFEFRESIRFSIFA
jgi:hypothetical protein